MSTSAPANVNANTSTRPMVPPEEQFWERYSPHNEAPLSGVSSTVVHILVIVLILGVAWVQSFLKTDEQNRSLPYEARKLTKAGGGGNPRGTGGTGPGDIGDTLANEADFKLDPSDVNRQPLPPEHQKLDVKPSVVQEFGNDGQRLVERPTTQFAPFAGLGDKARENLRKSVNPGGGGGGDPKGTGGPGRDGGRDTGVDKGQGGGKGEGDGGLSVSEKRILRWTLLFNTKDGRDYRNQLQGLGAIIAIPIDETKGTYKLIRDLRNPQPKEEDVSNLKGIFWIDDKANSVNALFGAFGLPAPPKFVAFFPKEMEDRMLRLELAFTETRYRTRDENKIHETRFDVFPSKGEYDIKVREVHLVR